MKYNLFKRLIHSPKGLILFSLLFHSTFSIGQWSPVSSNIIPDQIQFVNDSVGFATEFVSIEKTRDQGLTWNPIFSTPAIGIKNAHFFNENLGLALTSQQAYRTSNGGNSWTNVKSASSSETFWYAWLSSSQIAYIVGNDLVGRRLFIHKTINQGQSWSTDTVQNILSVDDIRFPVQDTGFICGISFGGSYVLRTYDGGTTWTNATIGIGRPSEMHFVNRNVGYVVGLPNGNNEIAKTIDGGQNWVTQNPGGSNSNISDIWFTSVDTGYVVGINGKFMYTLDGGSNWTSLSTNFSAKDITFINSSIGFISGSNDFLRTTNGGFSIITSLIENEKNISSNDINIYPIPSSGDIWIDGIEGGSVLVFDLNGKIVHHNEEISNNRLDLTNLPDGIYLLRFQDGEITKEKKITISR